MGWFKRDKEGITTSTEDKKETPEGLWHKCPKCKVIVSVEEHQQHLWVCGNCGYHDKIDAAEYFSFLFDNGKWTELDANMTSVDPLEFSDTKKYVDRLEQGKKKSGLKDAVTTGYGEMDGIPVTIAAMNFRFIGGSMGSVVGEKIARAIDHALKNNQAFIMISKSGGARMMEAAFSLMQMAKTSAKLTLLDKAGLPYISLLTDPTTGGVTASFAMLGDINIAEPGALIGFAGPRVVKETIGKDLPEGFQTSEFLLEHGFLDFVTERKKLKHKMSQFLRMSQKS
ncbi:acetyl-CoA carboxylase, carboxyltransferase subunit beta [Phaeocystidibacter marisrubri]|uniref:Acetyl-coenzyme A carboxylase carboxyl transferase subunit beta n=1 Tax=Phaeocystidibacter marisrubri TaxID=1577780 RepID=A0A6L3ZHP9_9FLAO|nr:acetyl-CoA carboxylase, carboxyltransferase subunit beta [Phaeocystidibacter marisrubri]KAB2817118.1 acetyl-CoA carboxylase carboxyltransferase subunit beta [Phaeocystidibacter marisrubri]GGH76787.1 acetyl-coenzyme A carboxylase carboxyl transferase subunit beta [Phaeocystidibacter marisrubri]